MLSVFSGTLTHAMPTTAMVVGLSPGDSRRPARPHSRDGLKKIMPRRRGDNNFSEQDTTTPPEFYYLVVIDGVITRVNGLINGITGVITL